MDYKKKVAELIKTEVDMDLESIEKLIEIPPRPEMGDFAFPCFQLAKAFRKAPNMIAEELKEKLKNTKLSDKQKRFSIALLVCIIVILIFFVSRCNGGLYRIISCL